MKKIELEEYKEVANEIYALIMKSFSKRPIDLRDFADFFYNIESNVLAHILRCVKEGEGSMATSVQVEDPYEVLISEYIRMKFECLVGMKERLKEVVK